MVRVIIFAYSNLLARGTLYPLAKEAFPSGLYTEKRDGAGRAALAKCLVQEIGITEAEARDLVTILGNDWSSLVGKRAS
jgi:hypothetical protein